ncbi:TRAP dicarboxylate transporter subunit DctP [Escherichia coli]|nr:TRAP dicarboxylate transporter subunit DctP [Escherichia coli]
MELIRSGAIPLVKTNAAEMEAFENSYKLFSLPYLFRDRDHYYQVMQGDIGRKIPRLNEKQRLFRADFL